MRVVKHKQNERIYIHDAQWMKSYQFFKREKKVWNIFVWIERLNENQKFEHNLTKKKRSSFIPEKDHFVSFIEGNNEMTFFLEKKSTEWNLSIKCEEFYQNSCTVYWWY